MICTFSDRVICRSVLPLRKLAPMDVHDLQLRHIHAFEAAHIDGPEVRSGTWPPEWQYAALRAEIVLSRMRVKLIQGKVIEVAQQAKAVRFDSMIQSASSNADGTIAYSYVVKISVDLELGQTAVA
jgi:hypothetical protein